MATPIIRVEAPQQGTGAFIAFAQDPDGSIRQLAGWEYNAYVAGGNPVSSVSGSTLASKMSAAPTVTANSADVYAYAGPAAGTASKPVRPTAPAPTPTSTSTPTAPTEDEGETPEEKEARQTAEKAQRDADEAARNGRTFLATLQAEFPWLMQIGLDPSWFQQLAANASGPAEMLVKIRATPQYKARFPGMWRGDGQVRMNEAQYMARETDFRQVLQQNGFDMSQYQTADSLTRFFETEQDPNEFKQRVETYRAVQQSSQLKKDAFYVYAGLKITDDDLYMAQMDKNAAGQLANQYNQGVAGNAGDYTNWITRATEVALQRAGDSVMAGVQSGALPRSAIGTLQTTHPDFARQLMDAIFTGGTGDTNQMMSLENLLDSFEYAAIGAAATGAGLNLPTKERLAEIRQAGIEKSAAIQAYISYGKQAEAVSGSVQRAGYDQFTQSEFESAQFLGDAELLRQLEQGLARDRSAGVGSGDFRFADEQGRLVQRGYGVR